MPEIDDPREAERMKRRHLQVNVRGDVAERVAALIAVGGRVGQLADADAVEDEDDRSGEAHDPCGGSCEA